MYRGFSGYAQRVFRQSTRTGFNFNKTQTTSTRFTSSTRNAMESEVTTSTRTTTTTSSSSSSRTTGGRQNQQSKTQNNQQGNNNKNNSYGSRAEQALMGQASRALNQFAGRYSSVLALTALGSDMLLLNFANKDDDV
jgi:flagellar biosynthesis/type III secretory pathway M-ring protein FliF/YscJ